jgi:hypothetical protein
MDAPLYFRTAVGPSYGQARLVFRLRRGVASALPWRALMPTGSVHVMREIERGAHHAGL